MPTTYRWKPGSTLKVDAQTAGEELERIRHERGGTLIPGDVVEASRSDNAPLHYAFEWNDFVAADAYRIEQTKYIIRSVEVVVSSDAHAPAAPVRAFTSIQLDKRPTYTSTSVAMRDADLREQILARALRDLAAWRARYAGLTELANIFAALDQAQGANEP